MTSAGVRPSPIAGTWYPGEREVLADEVDRLLTAAPFPPVSGTLVALISPHAGYRYSGACAASGFTLVRGGGWKRIIVLGPCHHRGYRGVALPEHDTWATPLGEVPVDLETCAVFERAGIARRVSGADRREHSIEIQIPFLQRALGDFSLVPLMLGEMDEADMDALAGMLRPWVGGETLLVASSDLTHYGASFGYVPFDREIRVNLEKLDGGAIRLIRARDWRGLADYRARTGITVCGIDSIEALLRALPEATDAELLRYYSSGDVTGEWDHVVSYASIGFFSAGRPARLGAEERQALLRSARGAIQSLHGEMPDEAEALPHGPGTSLLLARRGVFVTLSTHGELRGCIGTVETDRPLHLAVREQARASASSDPRFEPLSAKEMDDVVIEISVLSPLRPILSPEAYDPGEHGIVMEKDGCRALFLPQVAREQNWDRETALRQLALKAGLPQDAWREACALSVFTAEVFSESDPGA